MSMKSLMHIGLVALAIAALSNTAIDAADNKVPAKSPVKSPVKAKVDPTATRLLKNQKPKAPLKVDGLRENQVIKTYPYLLVEPFPKIKFRKPMTVVHANDDSGRIFVVEQDGWISMLKAGDSAATKPVTFLDMSKIVQTKGWEEGLLGLAFHPDYKKNGELYIYYTKKPQSSAVARLRVSKDDPNKVDVSTLEDLMVFAQPFRNHNGGSIAFGPDGMLYIGLGDGGDKNDSQGNGQNLSTLHGGILRIDVNKKDKGKAYAVPSDNPFVNVKNARPEIWAYGIRNAWQLSFDQPTGRLWMADVGQFLYEEINIIERGGNYGWSVREGKNWFYKDKNDPKQNYIDPIWEYHHVDGKSITGGHVYRGQKLGYLKGRYIYADFVTGRTWALHYENGQVINNEQLAPPMPRISGFGRDQAGELYVCTLSGKIYQFEQTDDAIPDEEKYK